jgi:hypothetical protein
MDINRCAVLVTPRAAFLAWAERYGDGVPYPVGEERNVYLLPWFALASDIEEILAHYYDIIFESELEEWMSDESTWPEGRSYALFREWFDVEVNSSVVDLVAGEPLILGDDEASPGDDDAA